MNNLVVMKDRQAVTSSLQVAETFNKQHKDVLEAIRNKVQSAENSADYKKMFASGKYYDCHFVATTPAGLFKLVFDHVSKVLKNAQIIKIEFIFYIKAY